MWTHGICGVALTLVLSGCGLDAAWVKAARETHDVVAPAHRAYVNADASLTADQKARRHRLLDSWGARIEEAEKHVD